MDNIANMLVQIKNAQAIGKKTAVIPFSKTKFAIAKILEKTNFIAAVGTEDRKEKKVLVVDLKYQNQKPAISGIKRMSKPGCRIYVSYQDLKPVKQGRGLAILSSSKGILTDKEAKEQKAGGELLCQVW